MAILTRANGDLLQVANFDAPTYTNSGVDAVGAGVVQPQGPKLDFFTVTGTGALTGAQVTTVLKTIAQLATVHIYEYVNDTNDSVAVAIYPTGAWVAADIDTELTAAGVTGTTTTDGATFGA